jgi:hypothetical protein
MATTQQQKKSCQHAMGGRLFTKMLPTCVKGVTSINTYNLCGEMARDRSS